MQHLSFSETASGNSTSRPDTRRMRWQPRKWPGRSRESRVKQAVSPSREDRLQFSQGLESRNYNPTLASAANDARG